MESSESPILPMPTPITKIAKGNSFAFMPDGKRVLVAASSRAWMASLLTGELLFEFEKPARFVSRIAVSDDGIVAAVAQSAGRVTFYDPETGRKSQTLKVGSETDGSGLAFAPNSHVLLHSDRQGVTMVDVDNDFVACSLKASEAYPNNTQHYAIAFAASGDYFACLWAGHMTTDISLFQWPSGSEIHRLHWKMESWQPHSHVQLCFTPDNQSLLLTNPDGSVALHSLTDDRSETAEISLLAEATAAEIAPRFFLGNLCFSRDGKLLAYKLNGILGMWSWPSGICLGKWKASEPAPCFDSMGFSNSGRELVISFGGRPSGIFIYRTADFINSNLG